jgi:hypothetical protein
MEITRKSLLSGKVRTFDLDVTEEQMIRFENRRKNGEYVQTIFPHLSPSDREFILNGITSEEWEIFKDDE